MIEIVEHPTFSMADFSRQGKKPGLSAVVVLKNEQEFAYDAIESIRPYVDEIIIVYNDCRDATPEIVADFASSYPDQIRAFHYMPRIMPAGSADHRRTPPNSVHSIVHYYNFALSKATFQMRCKWDGDQIAAPNTFGPIVERLRHLKRGTSTWWFSPLGIGYWWYKGVNLWSQEGKVLVPTPWSVIGRKHDHAIWPAGRWTRFKKHKRCEYLFTRLLVHRDIGYMFYHLKGMKKDRGTDKYLLQQNPDSAYRHFVERDWSTPNLVTLEEFRRAEPSCTSLPDPAEIGIRIRT